jgi:hypothetical protein
VRPFVCFGNGFIFCYLYNETAVGCLLDSKLSSSPYCKGMPSQKQSYKSISPVRLKSFRAFLTFPPFPGLQSSQVRDGLGSALRVAALQSANDAHS